MSALFQANFRAANNADLRHTFQLRAADDVATPQDLTGATLRMRVSDLAGAPVLELTTGSGLVIGPDPGMFSLVVSAAVMATVPPGTYQHDLILTSGGVVTRIWAGAMHVDRGVTILAA